MSIKIYLVGGAIRDALLNLEPKELDFVVFGAKIEELQKHPNFTQIDPNFPVFINKVNKQEYALARREEKTGSGYRGFNFSLENVSLADDCQRRDFTINSLYLEVADNLDTLVNLTGEQIRLQRDKIIDPTGKGLSDLDQRFPLLRAVNQNFWQDPIRFLRAFRFAITKLFIIDPDLLSQAKHNLAQEDFLTLFRASSKVRQELESIVNTNRVFSEFFPLLQETGLVQFSYLPEAPENLFVSQSLSNILPIPWFTAYPNFIEEFSELFPVNTKTILKKIKEEVRNNSDELLTKNPLLYLLAYLCFNDFWHAYISKDYSSFTPLKVKGEAWQELCNSWRDLSFAGTIFFNQLSSKEEENLFKLLNNYAIIFAQVINILTQGKAFSNIAETFSQTFIHNHRLTNFFTKSPWLIQSLLYPFLTNSLARIKGEYEADNLLSSLDLNLLLAQIAQINQAYFICLEQSEEFIQQILTNNKVPPAQAWQELKQKQSDLWQSLCLAMQQQTQINLSSDKEVSFALPQAKTIF
ncbi:hypothetical protein CKF54_03250 [Psittacicella hinzii]|uniref:Poly A polymerase head domain-containing protein n=1 Tax=Psittacicella hinzii TaxID=2028575 RepID=A0A3A1Y4J3_9GAMM|nr:hypothetical protein [Psittacicella hinzii]RIY33222.1 hypothetical protein CKF54_03250 [Psittacicella hinzii]